MQRKALIWLMTAAAFVPVVQADAQLLPGGGVSLPPVGDTVGRVGGMVGEPLRGVTEGTRDRVATLARERVERLQALVRSAPDLLEMTREGPAVRGELVAMDLSADQLTQLQAQGFAVSGRETIEGLDIEVVRLRAPNRLGLDNALRLVRRLVPGATISANHLHLPSGPAPLAMSLQTVADRPGGGVPIGIIDGGVASHPALQGPIRQRGFVAGSPRANGHATAVASLIAGSGIVQGAAPGTPLLVADIYGNDPRGGNAVALAQAIGWMVQSGARVVAVSLAGPANPLVARAVAVARSRGTYVVAPVGNDGPASPAAFPAACPEAVSVTGVDSRGRVLIEAGRTPRLDYAAPGADMAAANANGGVGSVRGTSFAVPLVAGRLARHLAGRDALAGLDGEAVRGRGYGRGLVCGQCRTAPPRR